MLRRTWRGQSWPGRADPSSSQRDDALRRGRFLLSGHGVGPRRAAEPTQGALHVEPDHQAAGAERARATGDSTADGTGWVAFAGTMLAIAGVINIIYGIAAIDNAHFYINNAKYIVSDLNTGVGSSGSSAPSSSAPRSRSSAAPPGDGGSASDTAGLNAIAQLMFLPSYPFLALALFTIDILVIYGLIAYGGRRA